MEENCLRWLDMCNRNELIQVYNINLEKDKEKMKVKKNKKLMTIKEVTNNMVVHRIRSHKRIYVANLNSSGLQLSFRRIGIWK